MSGLLNGAPIGDVVGQVYSPTGELLTVQRASINASVIGDNTLVGATPDKKIYVLSLWLVCSSAVGVRFESGAGGTALTGVMSFPINGGMVLPFNPYGWIATLADNTLLNLELSIAGSSTVSGALQYVTF